MHHGKTGLVRKALAIFAGVIVAFALLVHFFPSIGQFVELHDGVIEACGTIFVAIFTCTLWVATQKLGDLAREQGDAMERSIEQATKATEATASIATVSRESAELTRRMWQKQMRAYVSVDVGQQTFFQLHNVRFAATPAISNTGMTPARNVSYHVMASILDANLRDDFVFEEFGAKTENDVTLHPRQTFTVHSAVRERFQDHEVEAIMKGEARRLYVWGIVKYQDIFGDEWETRFCFHYIFSWTKNDKSDVTPLSYIYRRHNSST
jgi:hypothetical protein